MTGRYDSFCIDGQWTRPAGVDAIDVISPYTEERVASVPAGTTADIDAAVGAARRAFDKGPWPRMSLEDRIAVLARVSDILGERRDDLAALVSQEMGCPITLSTSMQAAGPKALLDTFLALAPDYRWSERRHSATGRSLVLREPVGVVAAVIPWNAPVLIAVMKLAPALLAGCTVVLKPAPEAPLSAYLLAEALSAAGVPDGVVNIVAADREVGEYLVTHPGVDKITFTGSTAAGRCIAALCGQDLRRVTLELGGKSAAVILEDADLDATVESLRVGAFRNTGQVCSLKTRIVVSRKQETELLDRLTALVASMPIGDPADPATQLGPLVARRQRDRVENYIEIGRQEGAKVVAGGGRPAGLDRGWFVDATIFAEAQPSMRIVQEEIFGPVVTVLTYRDEAEAVAIANDSTYGLNGSVFTADPVHGLEVARQMRTGTVEINGSPVGFTAPIGGFKCSGIGREAGPEGFDAYVELKSVGLPAALWADLESGAVA